MIPHTFGTTIKIAPLTPDLAGNPTWINGNRHQKDYSPSCQCNGTCVPFVSRLSCLPDDSSLHHYLHHYVPACALVSFSTFNHAVLLQPGKAWVFCRFSHSIFPFLFSTTHGIMLFQFWQFYPGIKVVQPTWAFVVSFTSTRTGTVKNGECLVPEIMHTCLCTPCIYVSNPMEIPIRLHTFL